MMRNRLQQNKQKGFLEIIVIILVALILLNFLGIDIDSILAKEWVQEFISYVKDMLILVWQNLVKIFEAVKNSK